MRNPRLALAAGAAAMLAAWAAALLLLPFTPLAVGIGTAAACLVLLARARTTAARAVWFNVAFIVLAVGAFDAYVGYRTGARDTPAAPDASSQAEVPPQGKQQYFGDSTALFMPDDTLGVRPKPGLSTTARMFYRGAQVYDVVYSFDDLGLRIAPPVAANAEDCILFFGDSYTFGEGVNDDETMPYRVGVLAGARYGIRNFAFSGYGPHQMLAAIEAGIVDRAVEHCRPRYVIFPTCDHHVVRVAGIWSYDKHGPRYVLGDDGRPVRDGNFDSGDSTVKVLRALDKSAVATELRKRSMEAGAGDATAESIALYRAVLIESRRRLLERWPDLQFHLIYWDEYEPKAPLPVVDAALEKEGFIIHPITKILPPTDDPIHAYKLGDEVHPSARTHDLMAQYVVREILHLPGTGHSE